MSPDPEDVADELLRTWKTFRDAKGKPILGDGVGGQVIHCRVENYALFRRHFPNATIYAGGVEYEPKAEDPNG